MSQQESIFGFSYKTATDLRKKTGPFDLWKQNAPEAVRALEAKTNKTVALWNKAALAIGAVSMFAGPSCMLINNTPFGIKTLFGVLTGLLGGTLTYAISINFTSNAERAFRRREEVCETISKNVDATIAAMTNHKTHLLTLRKNRLTMAPIAEHNENGQQTKKSKAAREAASRKYFALLHDANTNKTRFFLNNMDDKARVLAEGIECDLSTIVESVANSYLPNKNPHVDPLNISKGALSTVTIASLNRAGCYPLHNNASAKHRWKQFYRLSRIAFRKETIKLDITIKRRPNNTSAHYPSRVPIFSPS